MLAEKEKNNTVMEKVYADVIAEIDQKLEQENALLSTSTSTPQKSNRSPSSHKRTGAQMAKGVAPLYIGFRCLILNK
jgi:hypothetical protein